MNAIITKDPETIDRLSYGYLEIVHFGFEDDGGKYHDGIYEFMPEEQPELSFHKGNRVELFGDFSHFKDTQGQLQPHPLPVRPAGRTGTGHQPPPYRGGPRKDPLEREGPAPDEYAPGEI